MKMDSEKQLKPKKKIIKIRKEQPLVRKLEMRFILLAMVHLGAFLFVALYFQSREAWVEGVVNGNDLILHFSFLAVLLIGFLAIESRFKKARKGLLSLKIDQSRLDGYFIIAFKRFVGLATILLLLVLAMYLSRDQFYGAIYAFALVYYTGQRTDERKYFKEANVPYVDEFIGEEK
jgi:hypothetical protein